MPLSDALKEEKERERGVHSISMMIPASDMNIVNSEKFVLNYQANEKKGPINNVTASARKTHNRTVVLPEITTARGSMADN